MSGAGRSVSRSALAQVQLVIAAVASTRALDARTTAAAVSLLASESCTFRSSQDTSPPSEASMSGPRDARDAWGGPRGAEPRRLGWRAPIQPGLAHHYLTTMGG